MYGRGARLSSHYKKKSLGGGEGGGEGSPTFKGSSAGDVEENQKAFRTAIPLFSEFEDDSFLYLCKKGLIIREYRIAERSSGSTASVYWFCVTNSP